MVEWLEQSPGCEFTSHAESFRSSPHAFYDGLRQAQTLLTNRDYGCRVATRHQFVNAALKDKALSVDATRAQAESYMRRVAGTGVRESSGDTAYEPPLVLLDDPTHRRVRQLVSRAFNPAIIGAMQPRIEEIADTLLNRIGERQNVEFIHDFAGPLPTMVILDMLGMSLEDAHQFKQWSEDILWGYDPERGAHRQQRLRHAYLQMSGAFKAAISARRNEPGEDLISRMLVHERGQAPGKSLTDLQIVSLCTQLMVAGNVTTTDLMGNGMYALLTHPDQLAWLRANPDRPHDAVEELLRFDCPITETARIPTENKTIAGCPVNANETLMLSLAAANHDPLQFEHPHELKLDRGVDQHVAFGNGIHVCLGAPLARLETQVALRKFLACFSEIQLDPLGELERRHLPFFRGFEQLPLVVAKRT